MSYTIAAGDWPDHLPSRGAVFSAVWKVARQVETTFRFASYYYKSETYVSPVNKEDLVSTGLAMVLGYTPNELQYLVPTLRRDLYNEAAKLMTRSGWEWDKKAKRWSQRSDALESRAPWMYGTKTPTENEIIRNIEGDDDRSEGEIVWALLEADGSYPTLLAYSLHGTLEAAAAALGISVATASRRVKAESAAARALLEGDEAIAA